jgi:flagellar biogenesis protein FliO
MRVLQDAGQGRLSMPRPYATTGTQGLASWVLGLIRGWRSGHEVQRKQLRLVESLSLGGKRQLMLVSCGEEIFLIGGGPESVEAIVQLNARTSLDAVTKSLDKICE